MRAHPFRRSIALAAILTLLVTSVASAAVRTDQADYAPGSVVTISGDNSNDAGYLPGETVNVGVQGPNGWTASCSGVADENGAWSCQVTLDSDPAVAVGEYLYTATGQVSGVDESGTFTDAINTQTTVTSTPNPSTEGQAVTFTATVRHAVGAPPSFTGIVTVGSVRFGAGSNCGGGFTILVGSSAVSVDTNGQASLVYSALAQDSHTIRACYDDPNTGTDAFNSSTGTVAHTVNAAPTNSAPIIAADNDPVTVNEGTQATNTGTWSDANAGDTVTLSASVGTVVKAGTNAGGTWSWSYTPDDGPTDSQTVTITADDGTTSTSATFSLTVNNVAPTGDLNNEGPVDEGSSANVYFENQDDPSTADTNAGFQYDFDCDGDDTALVTTYAAAGNADNDDCTFADNGLFDVVGRIFDKDDGYSTETTTVTVNNVAPSINSIAFVSSQVSCGTDNATLNFNFTDPGVNDDPWTIDIDWGDGNTSQYDVDDQGDQSRSHTYGAAGSYTAKVTVTDKDGGVSAEAEDTILVLYNVSGILQPIKSDGSSAFKIGSTIPVKIVFTDCDGSLVTDLSPTVHLKFLGSGTDPAAYVEEMSAGSANVDNVMRWSSDGGQYIYNLSTKKSALNGGSDLTQGSYELKVKLNGVQYAVAYFSLRK